MLRSPHRHAASSIAFAASLCACSAEARPFKDDTANLLEDSLLQARADRLWPSVEEALQVHLERGVRVRAVTSDELRQITEREVELGFFSRPPDAAPVAPTPGMALIAKYVYETGELVVEREGALRHLRVDGMTTSRAEDLLDALVLHELVHAADAAQHHVFEWVWDPAVPVGDPVRGALVEGHAQYVARHILAAQGRELAFEALLDLVSEPDPDQLRWEAEQSALAEGRFASLAYLAAWQLFESMPDGEPERMQRLMDRPPRGVDELFRPEWYGAVASQKACVLPVGLAEAARGVWGEQDGPEVAGSDASTVASLGMLYAPREELFQALAGYRCSARYVLHAAGASEGRMVRLDVAVTDSPAAAAALASVLERVAAAHAEGWQEGGRVDAPAHVGALRLPGGQVGVHVRTLGQRWVIPEVVEAAVIRADRYVVQVSSSRATSWMGSAGATLPDELTEFLAAWKAGRG